MRRANSMVVAYLQAMGSRISTGTGKSHSFASSKAGRRTLKTRLLSTGREVLVHWRDLGANTNVSRLQRGHPFQKDACRSDAGTAHKGPPWGRGNSP